jgi:hypothetical protein
MLAIGSLSALAFASEALLIRWLCNRGVPGAAGGLLTLFFDGVYGCILLSVLLTQGATFHWATFWHLYPAGLLTCTALVLVNYAVANGIAGIAFSMANAFPAWHAVVMFIFYS